MVGRKVVPISIKEAKGTNRKHREKEVVPPSTEQPVPPAWLCPRAKEIFGEMTVRVGELRLASATYTEVLALLACRLEEVERFDRMLNEAADVDGNPANGYVYQTTNSFGDAILKEHPAVRLREKAARHAHSLLTEFGLTPAAAQKVGTSKKTAKQNDFDGF